MITPYHHGSLRAELLARAEQSIAETGVDELSLRQLARDLGVSHAAPARHFRDKQALLDALALQGFEQLDDAMRAAAARDVPLRERFNAVSRSYVAFAIDRAALLQLMYTTKHHLDASEQLRETGERALGIVFELLVEAQQAGAIAAGDPQRLAYTAFACVHGVAVLAAGNLLDNVPVDDALAETLDTVWRGMAPHA